MKSLLLTLICVFLLAGCDPEKRIVWSPDGKEAVVFQGNNIMLFDDQGKILVDPTELKGQNIEAAAWFGDSKRIVTLTSYQIKTWDEAQAILPDEHKNRIAALAKEYQRQLLSTQLDPYQKPGASDSGERQQQSLVRMYVRDHGGKELAKQFGNNWPAIEQATVPGFALQVFEVGGKKFKPGEVLHRDIDQIADIRLSPDDGKLAYTIKPPEFTITDKIDLFVTDAKDAGQPKLVDEFVSVFPDWSADGKYLAYGHSNHAPEGQMKPGVLLRRKVVDKDGRLLDKFGPAEELAGVMFFRGMRVRCLRDGRILFSAMEIHLPATKAEMPDHLSIFSVNPGKQATVSSVVPRNVLSHLPEMAAGFFEVNPDETQIAFAADDGTVAIFDMARGDLSQVQKQQAMTQPAPIEPPSTMPAPAETVDTSFLGEKGTLPAWQTTTSLTFIVPAGSKVGSAHRTEIVTWSPTAGYRCLSRQWPKDFAKKFLK